MECKIKLALFMIYFFVYLTGETLVRAREERNAHRERGERDREREIGRER
jgi:hypothetical protein